MFSAPFHWKMYEHYVEKFHGDHRLKTNDLLTVLSNLTKLATSYLKQLFPSQSKQSRKFLLTITSFLSLLLIFTKTRWCAFISTGLLTRRASYASSIIEFVTSPLLLQLSWSQRTRVESKSKWPLSVEEERPCIVHWRSFRAFPAFICRSNGYKCQNFHPLVVLHSCEAHVSSWSSILRGKLPTVITIIQINGS